MAIVKDIDHGWKKIKAEIAKMKDAHVDVGVLSKSPEYELSGEPNLGDVATWMEYGFHVRGGSYFVLPRPFMAQAFDRNLANLRSYIDRQAKSVLAGKSTVDFALNEIGVWYTGKVKRIFTQGQFAPNAPATKRMKKSTRPLIDTGRLRASITHEVKTK